MRIVRTINKVFGRSFCFICLKEDKVKQLDRLELCIDCFEKVKIMESEESFKLSKELMAGGIIDEL